MLGESMNRFGPIRTRTALTEDTVISPAGVSTIRLSFWCQPKDGKVSCQSIHATKSGPPAHRTTFGIRLYKVDLSRKTASVSSARSPGVNGRTRSRTVWTPYLSSGSKYPRRRHLRAGWPQARGETKGTRVSAPFNCRPDPRRRLKQSASPPPPWGGAGGGGLPPQTLRPGKQKIPPP